MADSDTQSGETLTQARPPETQTANVQPAGPPRFDAPPPSQPRPPQPQPFQPQPQPFRPPPPPGPPAQMPNVPQVAPQLQPQPWRPPYQPATSRGFSGWGQPWWPIQSSFAYPGQELSPMLPSYREALGLIGGAGRQLQMFSSSRVGQPAGMASQYAMGLMPLLDMLSKGQFSKNFWASRLSSLKAQQEQMIINAEQASLRHGEELMAFSRIFGTYRAGGMTPEEAHEAIEQLAMTTGHQNLIGILRNKGIPAVENYLNWEDQKYRDFMAGIETTKKSTKDGGKNPFQDGDDSGASEDSSKLPHRPDPLALNPDLPGAGAPTPETVADLPPDKFLETIRSKGHLNEAGMQAARNMLRGGDQPKEDKNGAVDVASKLMGAYVDRIAAASQGKDPEGSIAKIAQIDPGLAEEMERLRHGELDPKNTEHKGLGNMMRWLGQIDHGWDDTKYNQVKKLEDKDVQRSLTRAKGIPQAVVSILAALDRHSETSKIPIRWIEQGESIYFSGDPKYTDLYQALNNWATETIAVQAGGTPRVQLVKNIVSHLHAYMSPAQIRGQVQVDSRNSWSIAKSYDKDWSEATRRPGQHIPGWDLTGSKVMDAFLRSNTVTGEQPGDAPDVLKAYSKTSKIRPSWATPDMMLRPLTLKEIDEAKRLIADNENSTDPNVQRQLQQLRRRIGPTLD